MGVAGEFISAVYLPTYKPTNSYSGDANRGNINQGAFDFYFVRMFDRGRKFVNIDPQLIPNYETGRFRRLSKQPLVLLYRKRKASPTT
jgi:hypothetical protein